MFRTWRFMAACLPLGTLCSTGCMLPYAYPNLAYVPGCDFGTQATDCHVFRVDVSVHEDDVGEEGQYSIVEVERRSDGTIPPQLRLSIDRGYYVLGGATNFNVGWLHATRVRLYRPGYQLIELAPWESTDRLAWKPAKDWAEQEKAIDELVRRPAVSASESALRRKDREELHPRGTPTGWDVIASKDATVLAAAEYDRVAALAPTAEDITRLQAKARELRYPRVLSSATISSLGSGHLPTTSPTYP
jgi:hypothetical protein